MPFPDFLHNRQDVQTQLSVYSPAGEASGSLIASARFVYMVSNGTTPSIGPSSPVCVLIEMTEGKKKLLLYAYACVILLYAISLILEARSYMDL